MLDLSLMYKNVNSSKLSIKIESNIIQINAR